MCVHKCVFTDLICLYMLQLGEGKCVRTALRTNKDQRRFSENITRFYSRVRVRVRTVATPRFCTCAS